MSMTLSMTAAEWLGVLGTCLFALMMLLITMGRLLLAQIDKQLNARFTAAEEARKHASEQWQTNFSALDLRASDTDRRLMQLLIDLPNQYERRDDAIRREVAIIHRLDAVGDKITRLVECDITRCPIKEQLDAHG